MGVKNFLVEGVSGSGKTSVCDELQRRGYHSINGDRELAYQGDPQTGAPLDGFAHEHHIWDIDRVRVLVADQSHAASFFCGGSRNFDRFMALFDGVFVLEVDLDTLCRRLAFRPEGEWGGRANERELVARLHATRKDVPKGAIAIDATEPVSRVVDAILRTSWGRDRGMNVLGSWSDQLGATPHDSTEALYRNIGGQLPDCGRQSRSDPRSTSRSDASLVGITRKL